VINCRNGERFVRETIDSVMQQTVDDWDLVFWDNRSTDATAEIVKSYEDPRIRYFLSDSDDTLGQARNRALAEATGQWVAILDSDDIWYPDFLERQLSLLDETGASMVYSNAYSFYPDGKEVLHTWRSGTEVEEVDYRQLALDYDICISATVFERRVLSELTYVVDPELLAAEEADLFIRIASCHRVVFNPAVLSRYRMHSSSDTWTNSENFIRDARKIMQNLEKLGLDTTAVRDGMLEAAYWTAAMSSWMKRDSERARQHLRAMRGKRRRRYVLFCLTFLPYGLVSPLLRLAGKRAP
jgi:glycosyltransferase involved in cell wall biosynthesis